MRLSQFIKESKDLTDFLISVGFSFSCTEVEKDTKSKEVTKKIKYVLIVEGQEIIFDLRLDTICEKRKSLVSASLYRKNSGGIIYLPLLMERLGILRPTKENFQNLAKAESRKNLTTELQQYKELLANQLKATIEGKEWSSVYYNPLDY